MEPYAFDVGLSPDGRVVGGRERLGMPGPVWTMAVWFGLVGILLGASLLVPLNADARPELRALLMVYCAVVVALLVVLRQRATTWFIHLQVAIGILAILWLVYASATSIGAITSSNILIVVAAYVGFWMPRGLALTYVAVLSLGLIIVYGSLGLLPELLVPWLLLTGMSIGIVISFGTLVRRMKRQLITDPLTGLLNRSGMFSLIELGEAPNRLTAPRSLMVIDLDHFKQINDRRGHLAGDRILREFGAALRAVTRPDDIAIRSGGDEFVLLLPRTDREGAEALANRLRDQMPLAWSYGLSQWDTDEDFDAAWARADAHMYRNKAARSVEWATHDPQ